MTVQFYIPRSNDVEKGFDHTFERNAAVEIADQFYQAYHNSDSHYALVFNLNYPPADLIVITSSGIGVADFKHISGRIRGTVDNNWTIIHGTEHRRLEVSPKYKNPFEQVKKYRMDLYHTIKRFANTPEGAALPDWMGRSGQFHLQASVVFTDDCKIELNLDPDRTKPWFEAILQSKLPQWAYSLTFTSRGGRDPLTIEQIETLTHSLLGVDEWTEIQGLVAGTDIYGYLTLYDSNQTPTHHPLSTAITALGREADNSILLGAVGVSRHHARIVYDTDYVYLEDLGSTNGTWLNGERLDEDERRRLHDGDQIIFGPCKDGRPKSNAQRGRFATRIHSSPETAIFPALE